MKLGFDMKKGLPEDSKNHSPIGGGGIAPKIKHFMFDPHLYIYLGEDYQMGSKLRPLVNTFWSEIFLEEIFQKNLKIKAYYTLQTFSEWAYSRKKSIRSLLKARSEDVQKVTYYEIV